jgi:hypothetical protein
MAGAQGLVEELPVLNDRQRSALEWLAKPDKKRMLYEGGDPKGRGSGEYYIDYSSGNGPTLNRADVEELIRLGYITQKYRDVSGCYVLT